MRCIVTADWHYGSYRNGVELDGVNQRLLDIQERVRDLIHYCLQNNIKSVVFCGDMFKDKMPTSAHLTALSEALQSFIRHGIKFYAIIGNHDISRVRGEIHALSMFQPLALDGIHIIDQPTSLEIEGRKFFFFPYRSSPQAPALRDALVHNVDEFLVVHGSVEGAILNAATEYEIQDDDTIPLQLCEGFRAVFAGHIHHHQHFANVWYPGSLERLTFHDEADPKGFYDVQADGEQFTVTFVPAHARPMKTLQYDQLEDVKSGKIDIKGAIIRVRGADRYRVQEIQQLLSDHGCHMVTTIQTDEPELQASDVRQQQIDLDEFIKKYAEKVQFAGDVPNVSKMIREALSS